MSPNLFSSDKIYSTCLTLLGLVVHEIGHSSIKSKQCFLDSFVSAKVEKIIQKMKQQFIIQSCGLCFARATGQ